MATSGSRVVVALCALACGLSFAGIAVKTAMTACGEVVETDPATGETSTRYLFEWSECAGTDRLRALQTGIAIWGGLGAISLAIAGVSLARAREGTRRASRRH